MTNKEWLKKRVEKIIKEIDIQIGHHKKEDNIPATNSLYHIRSFVNKTFPQKKIRIWGTCPICKELIIDMEGRTTHPEIHKGAECHYNCIQGDKKLQEIYNRGGIPAHILKELGV